MSYTLRQEILYLLDNLHKIRSDLFFDINLIKSKTVAEAMTELGLLHKRWQIVYEVVSGEEAPIPQVVREFEEPRSVKVQTLDDLYKILKQDMESLGLEVEELPEAKIKNIKNKTQGRRKRKTPYKNNANRKKHQ